MPFEWHNIEGFPVLIKQAEANGQATHLNQSSNVYIKQCLVTFKQEKKHFNNLSQW